MFHRWPRKTVGSIRSRRRAVRRAATGLFDAAVVSRVDVQNELGSSRTAVGPPQLAPDRGSSRRRRMRWVPALAGARGTHRQSRACRRTVPSLRQRSHPPASVRPRNTTEVPQCEGAVVARTAKTGFHVGN
jgi:hypothetical protein